MQTQIFNRDGSTYQITGPINLGKHEGQTARWFVDKVIPCDGYESTQNVFNAPSFEECYGWLMQ